MSKNRKVIFLRKENGDGQGEFYYPDGSKYVGSWKNDEWNGLGTYIYYGGKRYEGEYKNGKEWKGIYYNKNGTILFKYVNGEMIK